MRAATVSDCGGIVLAGRSWPASQPLGFCCLSLARSEEPLDWLSGLKGYMKPFKILPFPLALQNVKLQTNPKPPFLSSLLLCRACVFWEKTERVTQQWQLKDKGLSSAPQPPDGSWEKKPSGHQDSLRGEGRMQLKLKVSLYVSTRKLSLARRCSGIKCLLPLKSSRGGQSLRKPKRTAVCNVRETKAFVFMLLLFFSMWFGSSSDLWKGRGDWVTKVENRCRKKSSFANPLCIWISND